MERRILWGVRIALVAALAFSVAFPDLPQFDGKGMAFRAPFFLLPMAAVPVGWRLRGRREPYPYLADALVISPFLVDTLGNALNFYNSYDATDDVLHVVNWVLLVAGITLLLLRTSMNRLTAWALGYGIGGLAIIWWEAAEWLVQELGTAGLQLTYGDTIGDLMLSSTGGALGALLAVRFGPRRATSVSPSGRPSWSAS
ncbi:MAG TPA: hypothetical protein VK917_03405 [Ilumatobacter sp.]|nr:hypothetical protein [Ilumatobacter sp.]